MRKFLETHGELKSKNDFVGFLVTEFDIDQLRKGAGPERPGTDG